MNKKLLKISFLLLGILLTGCGDKEQAPVEDKSEKSEAIQEVEDREQQEVDLMYQFLDVDAYIDANGTIAENELAEVIDEIEIDGLILKIGMSYDEVLELGFEPLDETFKDTKTGALAYTSEFQNKDGNIVILGFIGEEDRTVAEGVLYSVQVKYVNEDMAYSNFKVENLSNDSTIQEILDTLGNPVRIDTGGYEEYQDMKMEYQFKNRSVYLKFFVDLETEKILTATLEGYEE